NQETSESFTAIARTLPAIEPFRSTFNPSATKATAIQFKEIKAPSRLDLQRSMKEIYKENAYCNCLNNRFKNELGNNFETALEAEREKTKKKILEGYGKKFVNQFTSHIENVTFFLNQNG